MNKLFNFFNYKNSISTKHYLTYTVSALLIVSAIFFISSKILFVSFAVYTTTLTLLVLLFTAQRLNNTSMTKGLQYLLLFMSAALSFYSLIGIPITILATSALKDQK